MGSERRYGMWNSWRVGQTGKGIKSGVRKKERKKERREGGRKHQDRFSRDKAYAKALPSCYLTFLFLVVSLLLESVS
jgi:hypothetical protein